jgi:hypothetical protein
METRILGRTGLEIGVIGLGTQHLAANRETMDAVLDLAVPAGVNYVDLVFNDPLDAHADYWNAIGPAARRHRGLVLALHWGFVYHEPVDRCRLCFDQALKCLGNGYAEITMITMVDTEPLWRNWAMRGIERWRYAPGQPDVLSQGPLDPGIHGGKIVGTTRGTPLNPPQIVERAFSVPVYLLDTTLGDR